MASVFVTGASGFVGVRVVRLLRERGHRVVGLVRTAPAQAAAEASTGDLLEPASYESKLAGIDIVVHLAALTGKARPEDYIRVNLHGTQALLEASRRMGVRHLLFCSTIAAGFRDIRDYPYAQSKAAAEGLVVASGIATTVIRPTIVAGPGSPVMRRLADLAALPVVPAFNGGRARIQPILVDDLAAFVLDIVETARFSGEVLDLGGPDVLSMRELLDRMHRYRGGKPARFLNVPLGLVLPPLRALERVAYGRLPLTVGQLASFRFDGIARPNAVWEARRGALAPIHQMIAESLA